MKTKKLYAAPVLEVLNMEVERMIADSLNRNNNQTISEDDLTNGKAELGAKERNFSLSKGIW